MTSFCVIVHKFLVAILQFFSFYLTQNLHLSSWCFSVLLKPFVFEISVFWSLFGYLFMVVLVSSFYLSIRLFLHIFCFWFTVTFISRDLTIVDVTWLIKLLNLDQLTVSVFPLFLEFLCLLLIGWRIFETKESFFSLLTLDTHWLIFTLLCNLVRGGFDFWLLFSLVKVWFLL